MVTYLHRFISFAATQSQTFTIMLLTCLDDAHAFSLQGYTEIITFFVSVSYQ